MRSALQGLTYLLVASVAAAGERPTLEQAVALSIQGKHVKGFQLARHGFDLKPIGTDGSGKRDIVETATSITLSGSIHHRIKGKNDVVYYWIAVEKGKTPRGVITSIKYRGIRTNVFVRIGSKVAGAVVPGVDANEILDAVNDIQRWRIGSWEESAQTIVGEIARQLDRQVQ